MGGKEKWRMYQHPLMECVDHVPFGDAGVLEEYLSKGCYMAFYVEPIQGEGGIIVPPEGYLTQVRELCDKYDTYFVADEIQAGCARTGKMWAVDHEGEMCIRDRTKQCSSTTAAAPNRRATLQV